MIEKESSPSTSSANEIVTQEYTTLLVGSTILAIESVLIDNGLKQPIIDILKMVEEEFELPLACTIYIYSQDKIEMAYAEGTEVSAMSVVVDKQKKIYAIELKDGSSFEDCIEDLIHEMVHIKQFYGNQLHFTPNGTPYWKGSQYCSRFFRSMKFLAYNSLPWEKEAIKYQKKLYRKYMRSSSAEI